MISEGNLRSSLSGVLTLEMGDQRGDYATMLLAGLGSEVVKIEPLDGSPSRRIGPFAADAQGPEESLFFWRYNLGKKSLALDLDKPAAEPVLTRMAGAADVIVLAGEFETVAARLERIRPLAERNPRVIVCTITPFGLDGPWRALKATDLTQMALGGIMAVCGYDPDEQGNYHTPPIAPAMWHSHHIAGEYAAIAILAALSFRELSGEGQFIDVSIHEAVNTCTEIAIPTYVYTGLVVKRQTARHAAVNVTQFRLSRSIDGVEMLASLSPFEREARALATLADQSGVEHVLHSVEFAELEKDDRMAAFGYRNELVRKIVEKLPAQETFERAQSAGLAWSPIRRPEDNLGDPHLDARQTFAAIDHPELGRELLYPATVASDGNAPHMAFAARAPFLGEHTGAILRKAGFTGPEIEDLIRRRVAARRAAPR